MSLNNSALILQFLEFQFFFINLVFYFLPLSRVKVQTEQSQRRRAPLQGFRSRSEHLPESPGGWREGPGQSRPEERETPAADSFCQVGRQGFGRSPHPHQGRSEFNFCLIILILFFFYSKWIFARLSVHHWSLGQGEVHDRRHQSGWKVVEIQRPLGQHCQQPFHHVSEDVERDFQLPFRQMFLDVILRRRESSSTYNDDFFH